MYYQITARDLHNQIVDYTDDQLVRIGRVKIDATEHLGGMRVIGTGRLDHTHIILHVEVAASPAHGNDLTEPNFVGQFIVQVDTTLGLESN